MSVDGWRVRVSPATGRPSSWYRILASSCGLFRLKGRLATLWASFWVASRWPARRHQVFYRTSCALCNGGKGKGKRDVMCTEEGWRECGISWHVALAWQPPESPQNCHSHRRTLQDHPVRIQKLPIAADAIVLHASKNRNQWHLHISEVLQKAHRAEPGTICSTASANNMDHREQNNQKRGVSVTNIRHASSPF